MKKTFSVIAFIFIASNLFALTVSDINNSVRRNMRDTDSSNPRYSDDVILDIINEGQADINNQTLLSLTVTNYVLTSGTSYYDLPADYFVPKEVYFKKATGETIKLSEVIQEKLYQSKPDWERSRGEPNTYWISDSTYALTGGTVTKRISYIPVPNNLSTGTITMWYFTQLDTLTGSGDIPFNGAYEFLPFHYALTYYVTMRLKIIDGITDEAAIYQNLYNNVVTKLRNLFGNIKINEQTQPAPAQ